MDEKKEKTWRISVTRQSGDTDEYCVSGASLYEAYRKFSEAFTPWGLAALTISEVKCDDRGAGVS